MMNEDEMATDKLSEGIRKFAADQNKMDAMVRKLLQGWINHIISDKVKLEVKF